MSVDINCFVWNFNTMKKLHAEIIHTQVNLPESDRPRFVSESTSFRFS